MRSNYAFSGLLAAFAVFLIIAGCSEPDSPEERVQAFISKVVDSAEERSWFDFKAYVSEGYADDRGLNKDGVVAIVTRYILANQRIFVLQRTASIDIKGPGSASAVVYGAIGGQPIERVEDLARITADVYRFEIDLSDNESGELQVTRGDWRPVPIGDFLVGD